MFLIDDKTVVKKLTIDKWPISNLANAGNTC